MSHHELPENLPKLSQQEFTALCQAFSLWTNLRLAHEQRVDSPPLSRAALTQISADVWHSALLSRMLVQGKPPLPEPPPLRHSYPDYEAAPVPGGET